MTAKFRVGHHEIGGENACFVIAEVGHNHQGDLNLAKQLMLEAKQAGASAFKLQKRNNKVLFTQEMYNKPYENENSYGKTYGEHREFLEFGEEEYKELQRYANELDIVFFSTVFDYPSLDFLEKINIPAYKLASGDLRSHALLQEVAKTGKPLFVSTGAASLEDVSRAYDVVRSYNDQVCILQCTASYPAAPRDIHLNVIQSFKREFPEAVIGYSGHDSGIVIPVVAYVMGARVIEKHFTLNRTMKGTDHVFSLEPQGMRKMIRDLNRVAEAFGSHEKRCLEVEQNALVKMGKSIVLKQNLKSGAILTPNDICFKSPGNGIPPSEVNRVLGKRLKCELQEDEVLAFEHLE